MVRPSWPDSGLANWGGGGMANPSVSRCLWRCVWKENTKWEPNVTADATKLQEGALIIGVGMPELQETALRVREHVIRLAGKGGCFVGASLSCADLMVYLYREFLRVNRDNPEDPAAIISSSRKGTPYPPSTAPSSSWAGCPGGGWPATSARRTASTGTRTGAYRGWSSTPARSGTCFQWPPGSRWTAGAGRPGTRSWS